MGFFKKIGKFFKKAGKGIKKGFKKVGSVFKPIANGVGKLAAATGIPIISQAGKALDMLVKDKVPEENIQAMEQAVEEQGVVRVDKVENTLSNYIPEAQLKPATQVLSNHLASRTGATYDDSRAKTSISTWDKVKQYLKKPLTWAVMGVFGLLSYLAFFKDNNNKKRKW